MLVGTNGDSRGYVPSACRGLAIPVLSNRPVPWILCRVSVLYFQFHAMLLSTRVPIGSEPTIATLRESCVLGKTEENICLCGGKNLPTLVYMYKTIVSAWEMTSQRPPAFIALSWLAWAPEHPQAPHLRTLCLHMQTTPSRSSQPHLHPHNDLARRAEPSRPRPALISEDVQPSSVIFPRLPRKHMSRLKPRSPGELQNPTIRKDDRDLCRPARKNCWFVPHFRTNAQMQ